MSAAEIIQRIEELPIEEQKEIFVLLSQKIISTQGPESKPLLGKKLSFDEACEVVFRENRELLNALAK